MNVPGKVKVDALPWLLQPAEPAVRHLALRDLLDCSTDDPMLAAAKERAHREGPIASILEKMHPSGYWADPGSGYNPKYRSGVWSLLMLAQLGADVAFDERMRVACDYMVEHGLNPGGQWSVYGSPSSTADCLQGNMCWALLELGYDHPQLESAFDWMARTVTGEGIAPASERKAPIRYYAGNCGPNFACGANNKLSCAWGAVKVMLAFGKLPPARKTPVIERAIDQGVDFLLGIDPATAAYPTGWTDKPSGNWWKFGFPVFYITDILQIVEALAACGYGNEPRLEAALNLIVDKQDEGGKWLLEYNYHGKTWVDIDRKKQPSKWVTLRALRVLKQSGWLQLEGDLPVS